MQNVVITGATGSVGTKVVELIGQRTKDYKIIGIAGFKNAKKLEQMAKKHKIKNIWHSDFNESKLINMVEDPAAHLIVIANSGNISLKIYKKSVKLGKKVAIASKEAIIQGGGEVMNLAKKTGAQIIPLDSEMVALTQLLQNNKNEINKIYLTCSGGPFLKQNAKFIAEVTPRTALKHPTWKMGKKISIESALWINKGYEIIEAHILFGIPLEKIEVIIHPQSYVHSIVEFKDGTSVAQLSINDMKIAINYALSSLSFDEKLSSRRLQMPSLSLINKKLEFFSPNNKTLITGINLVLKAFKNGKITDFINLSDNLIDRFLNKEIKFLDIYGALNKLVK